MDKGLVFPAYAGMFPDDHGAHTASGCFPRIRGDVPMSGRPRAVG